MEGGIIKIGYENEYKENINLVLGKELQLSINNYKVQVDSIK